MSRLDRNAPVFVPNASALPFIPQNRPPPHQQQPQQQQQHQQPIQSQAPPQQKNHEPSSLPQQSHQQPPATPGHTIHPGRVQPMVHPGRVQPLSTPLPPKQQSQRQPQTESKPKHQPQPSATTKQSQPSQPSVTAVPSQPSQPKQQTPPHQPSTPAPVVHPGRVQSIVHPGRSIPRASLSVSDPYATVPTTFATPAKNYGSNHQTPARAQQQSSSSSSSSFYPSLITTPSSFIPRSLQPSTAHSTNYSSTAHDPYQPFPQPQQPPVITRPPRTGPPIKYTADQLLSVRYNDDINVEPPQNLPQYLIAGTPEHIQVWEWIERPQYWSGGGGGGGGGKDRYLHTNSKPSQSNNNSKKNRQTSFNQREVNLERVQLAKSAKAMLNGTIGPDSDVKKWVLKLNPDEILAGMSTKGGKGSIGNKGGKNVPIVQVIEADEAVLRGVTTALNKLTPKNYSSISKKLRVELSKINDLSILQSVSRIFFEAAITNKQHALLYSRLLRFLTTPIKILTKQRQDFLQTRGSSLPQLQRTEHITFIKEISPLPDVPSFNPQTKTPIHHPNANVQSTTLITLLLSSCYLQLAGELPPPSSSTLTTVQSSSNNHGQDSSSSGSEKTDEHNNGQDNNSDENSPNKKNEDAMRLLEDSSLSDAQRKVLRMNLRKKRAEGTINLIAELFRHSLIPSPIILLCAHLLLGTSIHTQQQPPQQQQLQLEYQGSGASVGSSDGGNIGTRLNEDDIFMCCSLLEKAGKMLDFLSESFLQQQEVGKKAISARRQAKVLALADKTLQGGATSILGSPQISSETASNSLQPPLTPIGKDINQTNASLSVRKLNQQANVVNNILSMPEVIQYSPQLAPSKSQQKLIPLTSHQPLILPGNNITPQLQHGGVNNTDLKTETGQTANNSSHNPASILQALAASNNHTVTSKPFNNTSDSISPLSYSPQLSPQSQTINLVPLNLTSLSPKENKASSSQLVNLPPLFDNTNNSNNNTNNNNQVLQMLDAGSASPEFIFQASIHDLEPSFSPAYISIPVPSHAFQQLTDLSSLASPMKPLNLSGNNNGDATTTSSLGGGNCISMMTTTPNKGMSLSSILNLTPSVVNPATKQNNTQQMMALSDPQIDLSNSSSLLPSLSPLLRASNLRSTWTETRQQQQQQQKQHNTLVPPLQDSFGSPLSSHQPDFTAISPPLQSSQASTTLSAMSNHSNNNNSGNLITPSSIFLMYSPELNSTNFMPNSLLPLDDLKLPSTIDIDQKDGQESQQLTSTSQHPSQILQDQPQQHPQQPQQQLQQPQQPQKQQRLILKSNPLVTPRTLKQFRASVELLFDKLSELHKNARIEYDLFAKHNAALGIENNGEAIQIPVGHMSKRIFYKIEDLLSLRANNWDTKPPVVASQPGQNGQKSSIGQNSHTTGRFGSQGTPATQAPSKFLSKTAQAAAFAQNQHQTPSHLTKTNAQSVQPPPTTSKKDKDGFREVQTPKGKKFTEPKSHQKDQVPQPQQANSDDDLTYLLDFILSVPIGQALSPVPPPHDEHNQTPFNTQQCSFFSSLIGVDPHVTKLHSEMTCRLPILPLKTDILQLLSELFMKSPFLPFIHATNNNLKKCFHSNTKSNPFGIQSGLSSLSQHDHHDDNNDQDNNGDDDDLHFDLDHSGINDDEKPLQPCYFNSISPLVIRPTRVTATSIGLTPTDTKTDLSKSKSNPKSNEEQMINAVILSGSRFPSVTIQLVTQWWRNQLIELTVQLLQWLLVNNATNPTKQTVSVNVLKIFFDLIISTDFIDLLSIMIKTEIIPNNKSLSLEFGYFDIDKQLQNRFSFGLDEVNVVFKRFAVMYSSIKEDSPRCINVVGQVVEHLAQLLTKVNLNRPKPSRKRDQEQQQQQLETTTTPEEESTPPADPVITFKKSLVSTLQTICPEIQSGQEQGGRDAIEIEDAFVTAVETQSHNAINQFHSALIQIVQLLPLINTPLHYGLQTQQNQQNGKNNKNTPKSQHQQQQLPQLSQPQYSKEQKSHFYDACFTLLTPTKSFPKLIPGFHLGLNQVVVTDLTSHADPYYPDFLSHKLEPIDQYFISNGYFSTKTFLTDLESVTTALPTSTTTPITTVSLVEQQTPE